MSHFIKQLFIFATFASLLAVIYIAFAVFILPKLLELRYGPSTQTQIQLSFENSLKRDYQMLILGNSRLYRGFNPDVFALKTYNFSHDNDTYNQLYYKLLYLKKHNKHFQYLILGIDYFQFSFLSNEKNYIYINLFDEDYLRDYSSNSKGFETIKYKLLYYLDMINPAKLRKLAIKRRAFLKENGQYICFWIASPNDNIKREYNRIPIQVDYFEKILRECNQNKITVFLVMPPLRENEYRQYLKDVLDEYENFFNKHTSDNCFYLNYSLNHDFKLEDFADITHLNETAADKFSRRLSDDIINLIGYKNAKKNSK